MKKSVKNIIYALVLVLVATSAYSLGFSSRVGLMEEVDGNNKGYSKIINNIESIEKKIEKNYLGKVDKEKFETGIYKGVVSTLNDPYSVYFSEDEYKSLMEQTAGEFGGVGIQVNANENGFIEVVAPIKGTPGDKAGILPGDFITHINGEQFSSSQMEEAVKVMRGKAGESVKLTILRKKGNSQKIIDLDIKREIIKVDSVFTKLLENNIGYIQLTGFQEKSGKEFINAVEKLKKEGAKKLILDLRNNPGGLLNVAMEIADYLLDSGVVISVRYKDTKLNEELKTVDGKEDMPLTVLINKGSASASEVLSGALQDHKRAKLIGQKTFGKGVIQQIYPINNNGKREGMKLTIAEFYTPNGHKIHGQGISPDVEIKLPEGVRRIGIENLKDDLQLQEAIKLSK